MRAGGAGGAHLSVSPPPSPGIYPTWDHILNTGGKRGWGPASPGLVPEEQEVAPGGTRAAPRCRVLKSFCCSRGEWGSASGGKTQRWLWGCWIHPTTSWRGFGDKSHLGTIPAAPSSPLHVPPVMENPKEVVGPARGLRGAPKSPLLSQILPCLQHEEAAGPNRSLEQRVQDLEQRSSEASTLQHIQATLLYDMQAQINNVSVLTDWVWRNPTCLGPADIRLQEEMHRPGDGEMLGWEKRVSILFARSLVSASLPSRVPWCFFSSPWLV